MGVFSWDFRGVKRGKHRLWRQADAQSGPHVYQLWDLEELSFLSRVSQFPHLQRGVTDTRLARLLGGRGRGRTRQFHPVWRRAHFQNSTDAGAPPVL